jgi:hypothetical protein
MKESKNTLHIPPLCIATTKDRCSTYKNWSRFSIDDWPDEDKPSNIGACSVLENDVNYYD